MLFRSSQYSETAYEPESWAALTKLYQGALAAVDAAVSAEELPLLTVLAAAMAEVPVKAQTYTTLSEQERQAVIQRLQTTYETYLQQIEDKASAFAEASRGVWLKRTAEIVYHQFRNLRDVQLHALLAAEADEVEIGRASCRERV